MVVLAPDPGALQELETGLTRSGNPTWILLHCFMEDPLNTIPWCFYMRMVNLG